MGRPTNNQPSLKSARDARARICGFSLVEVVLAIGVTSFAFIPIMTLLPMGLTDFQSSTDTSVGAQIGQQMINQAQESDFAALPLMSGSISYFDVDGRQLANSTGSIYQARALVTQSLALPGDNAAGNSNMATVTVQIANNPGNQYLTPDGTTNLWKAQPGVSVRTCSTVVSGCGVGGN